MPRAEARLIKTFADYIGKLSCIEGKINLVQGFSFPHISIFNSILCAFIFKTTIRGKVVMYL